MADKTALNTSYTYFSDIVFATGFVAASGNFEELVSDTNIGVVGGDTSRSSDATHGSYVRLENGTGEVNFGDNALWDGMANLTVAVLAQSDHQFKAFNENVFKKVGGGDDAYSWVWQSSENTLFKPGTGITSAVITDGLDDGDPGQLATNWNLVGGTYDGSNTVIRIQGDSNTEAATGSVPVTAHDLVFGDRWDGNMAMAVVMDVALTNTEWGDIVLDPTGTIFAAEGGGGLSLLIASHHYRYHL